MLLEGLGTQDFGDVVSHGDDLRRKENRSASEKGRLLQAQGPHVGHIQTRGRSCSRTCPGLEVFQEGHAIQVRGQVDR